MRSFHRNQVRSSLNQDLDQLAAKIEKSSEAVKAAAKPKLQALREQAAKLNQQLASAPPTGGVPAATVIPPTGRQV